MADKKFTVLHKKSSETIDNGKNPKLPGSGVLEKGEIAVNYAPGLESLSIENSDGQVVAIQNEVLVTDVEFTGDEITTAKIVIDESVTDEEVEMYTKADVDEKFATKDTLNNYYTKDETYSSTEVDDLINGIDVTEQLGDYLKKSEATVNTADNSVTIKDETLKVVTPESLNTTLGNYATEDYADSNVQVGSEDESESGVILIDTDSESEEFDLEGHIKEQVESSLVDYATKTELKEKVKAGTETVSDEAFILIDESITDATEFFYTKQQVDEMFAALRAEIEQLKKA